MKMENLIWVKKIETIIENCQTKIAKKKGLKNSPKIKIINN